MVGKGVAQPIVIVLGKQFVRHYRIRCQSTLGFNQCASELGERDGVQHDSARIFCGSSKPPLFIFIYSKIISPF